MDRITPRRALWIIFCDLQQRLTDRHQRDGCSEDEAVSAANDDIDRMSNVELIDALTDHYPSNAYNRGEE